MCVDSKYSVRAMILHAVWEHNEIGGILWSEEQPGASGRAATLDEAKEKLKLDIQRYWQWCQTMDEYWDLNMEDIVVIQEVNSSLQVQDADSDVLFRSETNVLTMQAYEIRKQRCIQSAKDFMQLYRSIPKKLYTDIFPRKTFYGIIPTTAQEMYDHINHVTSYYMGEIGVPLDDVANIVENRIQAFILLEKQEHYLQNKVFIGNYNEEWTLAKVMRRFIWHDTIHAKAMYRMALRKWNKEIIANPYQF